MSDDETQDAELRDELLRHYLSTADEKVARIAGAVAGLQTDAACIASIEEAYLALHTLAGNAGTYGFPMISSQALTLAKRLRKDQVASPDFVAALERFRDELREAFNRARVAVARET